MELLFFGAGTWRSVYPFGLEALATVHRLFYQTAFDEANKFVSNSHGVSKVRCLLTGVPSTNPNANTGPVRWTFF
jgi:hypothetical protein